MVWKILQAGVTSSASIDRTTKKPSGPRGKLFWRSHEDPHPVQFTSNVIGDIQGPQNFKMDESPDDEHFIDKIVGHHRTAARKQYRVRRYGYDHTENPD